jgi:hypothetical protein
MYSGFILALIATSTSSKSDPILSSMIVQFNEYVLVHDSDFLIEDIISGIRKAQGGRVPMGSSPIDQAVRPVGSIRL